MSQKENETLEDYVSRFMFNLQRNTQHQLNEELEKYIFINGVNDESIEALDLMAGGDITQRSWQDIMTICLNYSREIMKKGEELKFYMLKSMVLEYQRWNFPIFCLTASRKILNKQCFYSITYHARLKEI